MDFIFVYFFTFVLGYWIFKKIREFQNLPPGPWGVPLLGYLPFINANLPHLTMTELSKKYGPIYSIQMGSLFTVVLSDHKLVREAFAKESFSGRAPLYLTHGIMHGKGIICAEGPLWKDQRKLITSWLKSFGMSKHSMSRGKLEQRIADGVYELIDHVDSTASNGGPIDLPHMLTNSLGNIVNDIIFGYKFPLEDQTWRWFREIQVEGCHEMGVAGIVNFLPFLRFFSSSIRNIMKLIIRGQAQTHRLYASMIERRRKMLGLEKPAGCEHLPHKDLFKEHPKGWIKCITYSKQSSATDHHYFDPEILRVTEGECILDNFLIEQKRRFDAKEESMMYVTDEQLHYLLADMFGAGLDTTSVTLSWFLLYTAMHPEEQEIIRDEVLSVYPEETEIDSEKLPRLMAAICETQRIRSIVPVGIPHGCIQETYLAGYRIPKNTMVVPLQWAMHNDPDIWKDPEEFRPSRFLAPDGSLLKPQEFIPFQTGKRMCPGDELSRMLSAGFIARLLRRKRIKLAGKRPTDEQMQGIVGVTLAPPPVLYYCECVK